MKIKAYTIIELLVVMIISSMVVSFAFGVYFMSVNYSQQLQNKAGLWNEITAMEWMIKNDLNQSSFVVEQEEAITLYRSSHDSVIYILGDSLLRVYQQDSGTYPYAAYLDCESNELNCSFCLEYAQFTSCISLNYPEESYATYHQHP